MAREAGFLRLLDILRKNAHDVGAAGIQRADLVGCDVEAGDAKFFVAEQQCQRQAHIAHADNADAGLPGFDPLFEFCEGAAECDSHAIDCKALRLVGSDGRYGTPKWASSGLIALVLDADAGRDSMLGCAAWVQPGAEREDLARSIW